MEALNVPEDSAYSRTLDYVVSTSASHVIKPVTDIFVRSSEDTVHTPSTTDAEDPYEKDKVERLEAQLHAAQSELARKDQQLTQARITNHTLEQVVGSGSDTDFQSLPTSANYASHLDVPAAVGPPFRPALSRDSSWQLADDARSETSDTALSAGGFNSARARAIWNSKPTFGSFPPVTAYPHPPEIHPVAPWGNRPYGQPFLHAPMPVSAPADINTFRAADQANDRNLPTPEYLMAPPMSRRGQYRFYNRSQTNHPYAGSSSSYDGNLPSAYAPESNNQGGGPPAGYVYPPAGFGNHGIGSGGLPFSQFPSPVGTPLSPHAPEFRSITPRWKQEVSSNSPWTLFMLTSL